MTPGTQSPADGNMTSPGDNRILELIRTTRPLFATDPVSAAIALLRASGGSAAPVISGMQVAGIVHERDLLQIVNACSDDGESSGAERVPDISGAVRPVPAFIGPEATIAEAARLFEETGADVLPVSDSRGTYGGYLVRSDVIAALTNALRPAAVGGLATPLGVHLTCGSQRGGVSDAALVLLGVMFGLLQIAGVLLFVGASWLIQRWLGQPLYAALLSTPSPAMTPLDLVNYASMALPILVLLLGIRYSRVAGYHAAEHQTVNAIERGEPLDMATVRRMPRVHPRCGTNLAAAASVFVVLTTAFPSPVAVFLAIIVVLLAWRSIGAWLQTHVTTRRPSDRQIESGIRAGQELLARYREEVLGARPAGRRFWNLGFVQIGMGLALTMLVTQALIWALGVSIPLL